MKKERLFYLDFVRALAVVSIVITHYNAIFLYMNPVITHCYIINAYIFNVYIGNFGVSLFLIISGASLMYVYENSLKLKDFYYKRFKSLYPMFWLAYTIAFLYSYVYHKGWSVSTVPRSHLLLSVIGFDGYLGDQIPTFYLVGEWFLGFIILFYMVFPLLRWLVNNHPIILVVATGIMYVLLLKNYHFTIIPAKNLLVRLPELLFGMYFIKLRKKVKLPVAVFALLVLVCNQLLKPQFSQDLQVTYIGIFSYLLIVYISYFVKNVTICNVCAWISKYSYAIFLVHHIVIYSLMGTFNLYAMTTLQSYLVFFGLCFVIASMSWMLYQLHARIERRFGNFCSSIKCRFQSKE